MTAALERQTLAREDFEVISVDGGELPPVPPGVRLVYGPPRNSYAARNRAAALAGAAVLAFTDADCRPTPNGWSRGLRRSTGRTSWPARCASPSTGG